MSMPLDNGALATALRPRGPITLRVVKRTAPGLSVLEVGGEVDLLTAGRLATDVDHEVRRGDGDLVVDLRGAEFMDSVGLHVLLNAQRRLTRQGRRLAVVCPPGPVRRVLELARLLETLGVVSTMPERVEAALPAV